MPDFQSHGITNAEVIAQWAEKAETSVSDFGEEGDFARQHLLNPAVFTLLGEVEGFTILDAGCGNGYLSRLLVKRGAFVTGVEPALYRLAIRREQEEPLGIHFLQEDLSHLVSSQPYLHAAFDRVIANMVLQDIPECEAAIANCLDCLKPGGVFVFSILHPCFEDLDSGWSEHGAISTSEYFAARAIPQKKFGHFFHRPLSYYLNSVLENGGRIRRVVEPQLSKDFFSHGKTYERDHHVPSFIVVKATREL